MAAFCTKCGTSLEVGREHICLSQHEQAASIVQSMDATNSAGFTLDTTLLVNLLKNPFSSLYLEEAKGFTYGIISILASLLGFYVWAWSFKKQVISMIADKISGGFGGFGSKEIKNGINQVSDKLPIDSHFLLLGIISIAALIILIFLVGNWLSGHKRSFKDIVTKIGSMQFTFSVVYIILAIVNVISLKLGFALLAAAVILNLFTALIAAMHLYGIKHESSLIFSSIIITAQLVIVLLTVNSLSSKYASIFTNIGDSLF